MKLSKEIIDQIGKMYIGGKTAKEIAIELNIPYTTIRNLRTQHGWTKTPENVVGNKYGRLTVIAEPFYKITGKKRKQNSSFVKCRCDCGKEVEAMLIYLKNGNTRSCGCLAIETAKEKGFNSATHGMSHTRLYRIWAGMKDRCTNSNDSRYYAYGGKGISVFEDWMHFEPFCEWALNNGYNDELQIDRINFLGNYEPDNCRWATIIQQANNKGTTRILTAFGETKNLSEWLNDDRCLCKDRDILLDRLNKLKWDDERTISTPHKKDLVEQGIFKLNREPGTIYGNKRIWSQEEEKFIRDNYKTMTHEQMGSILNRTGSSVAKKFAELKILRPVAQIGDKFGSLTIRKLWQEKTGKQFKTFTICDCDCGEGWRGLLTVVTTGKKTTCGCRARV